MRYVIHTMNHDTETPYYIFDTLSRRYVDKFVNHSSAVGFVTKKNSLYTFKPELVYK